MMTLLYGKNHKGNKNSEHFFSYEKMFASDIMLRDEWMGIYYKNNKIGHSHVRISAMDISSENKYFLENTIFFALPIMGNNQFVNFKCEALVDRNYLLNEFSAKLMSSHYTYEIHGKHIREGEYEISVDAGSRIVLKKKMDRNVILTSILLPFYYIKDLKPLTKLRINTLNPLDYSAELLDVTTYDKETVVVNNEKINALKVAISKDNIESTILWIDEEARVVRAELPFHISMVSEPLEKAMMINMHQIESVDLYTDVSIPAVINKHEEDTIAYLKVMISGITYAQDNFNRYQLMTNKDGLNIIEVSISPLEDAKSDEKFYNEETLSLYCQPTALIQSDNKEIIKTASSITNRARNNREKIVFILLWIQNNINQAPVVSVPSAMSVLKNKRGDCNEISILFVGLLRSLGIPAYPVLGLVYAQGSFYYHSWVMVYLNEWIPIDPTFNQFPADASHIQLSRGSISQYVDVASYIGNVKIDILDYKLSK